MSSADLTSELRRAPEATAASILASAEEEARSILAEADAKVEGARRESLRTRETEYRAAARGRVASARRDTMRTLLEAGRPRLAQMAAAARGMAITDADERLAVACVAAAGDAR